MRKEWRGKRKRYPQQAPASTLHVLKERRKTAMSEWIFPSILEPEKPVAPGSAYQRLKLILKEAGLPDIRFHDLRHTFAVNSLKAGDDIKTVQENLGHHTASFTLDVYAHVTSGMKHDSANRMEQYLQRVTGESPAASNASA